MFPIQLEQFFQLMREISCGEGIFCLGKYSERKTLLRSLSWFRQHLSVTHEALEGDQANSGFLHKHKTANHAVVTSNSKRIGEAAKVPNQPDTMAKMMIRCEACDDAILDDFFMEMDGKSWHQSCLKCSDCLCVLSSRCYTKHGTVLCAEDYFKRFGEKCPGCQKAIASSELVQRVKVDDVLLIYHVECFACSECAKSLSGSNNVKLIEGRIVCFEDSNKLLKNGDHANDTSRIVDNIDNAKITCNELLSTKEEKEEKEKKCEGDWLSECNIDDFPLQDSVDCSLPSYGTDDNLSCHDLPLDPNDNQDLPDKTEPKLPSTEQSSSSSSLTGKRRGPRTTIKPDQLKALRAAFSASQKPTRGKRELLALETGLSTRVIQVWFQNRRSKERRLSHAKILTGNRNFFDDNAQRRYREQETYSSPNHFFAESQIPASFYQNRFHSPSNQLASPFSSDCLRTNSNWLQQSDNIYGSAESRDCLIQEIVTSNCPPVSNKLIEDSFYDSKTQEVNESCSVIPPTKETTATMYEEFSRNFKTEATAYWDHL